ncbi:hypothetical protein GOV09_03055 [Candidatus Woesearchaeota archaeon]|nr:hypothetical protein [Candidatus Woesearchaeota archaeon]
MKHHSRITYLLIGTFLLSQVIGLLIVNQYIDHKTLAEEGEIVFEAGPFGMLPPDVDENTSFIPIFIAIIIGTVLLLIIIKFRKVNLWKAWYSLSVIVTMGWAINGFLMPFLGIQLSGWIAFLLTLVPAYYKIIKPKVWVHNLTELLVYGGLAAIFVPILNVFSAFMLLLLISAYDAYAVWKSKHMVKLAKFTTEVNVFAGLSIPYDKKSGKVHKHMVKKLGGKGGKVKNAILGGGDIGFPLLFAGAVMKDLMLQHTFLQGFLLSLIIPVFTAVALYFLFVKGEKNKFYPAMPFLSLGAFIGYGIVLLVNLV